MTTPFPNTGRDMKVYLAGPINGCSDTECKDWRALAKAEIGEHAVFDPMVRDYRGRELEPGIAKVIVEQDKLDIYLSSAVLVYFDRPSVGTAMEVQHAWQIGKPVFVANASGKQPSPWLVYHSRCILPDLMQALSAVRGYHAR